MALLGQCACNQGTSLPFEDRVTLSALLCDCCDDVWHLTKVTVSFTSAIIVIRKQNLPSSDAPGQANTMKNAIIFAFAILVSVCFGFPKLSRPRLYGTAIPQRDLDPRNHATRRKILMIHNFFRTRVNPPAADMLEVSWHDEAAEDAQRWAEQCQLLLHDNITGRWTDDFGSCGQNIFVANVQVPWFFAAKVWFLERFNFTYGQDLNDPNVVGHYTQMVWYSTHKVGCGFNYCGANNVTKFPYYSYVCNYCPIGNHPERFDRPYQKGVACSGCEGHCKYKKLCTNGCPYADYWSNCQEMNTTWHNWLCDDETTDRFRACRATCRCENAIR